MQILACRDAPGIAGDDQFLIGRNDPQLHARSIGVKTSLGAVGQLRVAFGIHLDTEPVSKSKHKHHHRRRDEFQSL